MKIVFVYNAKSGRLSAALDIAHKILSPDTYACALCALTHDALSEKKRWAQFRQTSPHEFTFLHKDEFEARFEQRFDYPVILGQDAGLSVVMPKAAIERLESVDELITALNALKE